MVAVGFSPLQNVLAFLRSTSGEELSRVFDSLHHNFENQVMYLLSNYMTEKNIEDTIDSATRLHYTSVVNFLSMKEKALYGNEEVGKSKRSFCNYSERRLTPY